MKAPNFSEMTTEDLIRKKKTTSLVTGILAGMLIVLLGMAIFLTINKGFPYLIAVPLTLSPVLIMNFSLVNNINKELGSRNRS